MNDIEQALRTLDCSDWGRVAESIVSDALADMRARRTALSPGARTPLVRLGQPPYEVIYDPEPGLGWTCLATNARRWARGSWLRVCRFWKGLR